MASDQVFTTCYGKRQSWSSKDKAIKYFTQGMRECDTGSSEWSRYASIVGKLLDGGTDVDDT